MVTSCRLSEYCDGCVIYFSCFFYAKGLAGDAHFDDDEEFTTRRTNGVNLDWVAVHEFGHSLGLLHSNVRESIMFPWYKGYVPNIKLTDDDIQGIQERYGSASCF